MDTVDTTDTTVGRYKVTYTFYLEWDESDFAEHNINATERLKALTKEQVLEVAGDFAFLPYEVDHEQCQVEWDM